MTSIWDIKALNVTANGTPAEPEVGAVQGRQQWQEDESALAILLLLPSPLLLSPLPSSPSSGCFSPPHTQ